MPEGASGEQSILSCFCSSLYKKLSFRFVNSASIHEYPLSAVNWVTLLQRTLLNLKAKVLNHLMIKRYLLPGRRQVIPYKNGVGGIKGQRLKRTQIFLPASRDADLL